MAKAMVIDDSRAIRMILSRILREIGYEVSQAANGKEALSLLGEHDRDVSLILVDWNMPEMNGLEFVRRVRSDPSAITTTLMMVTTETEVAQMVTALTAGADEYVMKPFTKEVITDKLRLLGAIPR